MKGFRQHIGWKGFAGSASLAWTPQSLGVKVIGWFREVDEVGGQQPNKMRGTSDYLTVVSGSGLNKVYTLPNTTAYKNADTDYCWWKTDGSLSTTDGNRLIAYDFARTIVKYDSASPYALREIIILAAGATLTTAEMNKLRDYAQLSIWWSNVSSDHGMEKGNRTGEQAYWIPALDPAAAALIARMVAAGETPTAARQAAINTCIVSLKANGLFDTQFDDLVVTRAHGPYSGLMNWIGNTTNGSAINSPTFTANVGYNSNGTSSYLKSNYNAHTQGVLFTVNDAGFGFKISGTITSGLMGVNRSVAGGQDSTFISTGSLTNGSAINSYELSGSHIAVVGYNMNSRYDSAHYNVMRNSNIYNITANSNGITNNQMYLLNLNNPDGTNYYCNALLILEVYWMGKSMTQNQFNTFQTIMNAYFASL